jgi:hypothetical protein
MKYSRDVAGKSGTSLVVKIERGIDAQSQEFLDFVIKCSRRRNDALRTGSAGVTSLEMSI